MATLRETASSYADEIREGIAWVVVWKTGRGWNASAFWLSPATLTSLRMMTFRKSARSWRRTPTPS